MFSRALILLLGLSSLGLFAQTRGGSLGLSGSTAGVGLDVTYTGYSRWGVVVGFGGATRKDSDLPTEGYFNYISYSNRDWKDKTYGYLGPAFRVNENFIVGIGYAFYNREDYLWGVSPVTGWQWRNGTVSENKSGPVVVADFGAKRGLGGHVFASSAITGAGITWRF